MALQWRTTPPPEDMSGWPRDLWPHEFAAMSEAAKERKKKFLDEPEEFCALGVKPHGKGVCVVVFVKWTDYPWSCSNWQTLSSLCQEDIDRLLPQGWTRERCVEEAKRFFRTLEVMW